MILIINQALKSFNFLSVRWQWRSFKPYPFLSIFLLPSHLQHTQDSAPKPENTKPIFLLRKCSCLNLSSIFDPPGHQTPKGTAGRKKKTLKPGLGKTTRGQHKEAGRSYCKLGEGTMDSKSGWRLPEPGGGSLPSWQQSPHNACSSTPSAAGQK